MVLLLQMYDQPLRFQINVFLTNAQFHVLLQFQLKYLHRHGSPMFAWLTFHMLFECLINPCWQCNLRIEQIIEAFFGWYVRLTYILFLVFPILEVVCLLGNVFQSKKLQPKLQHGKRVHLLRLKEQFHLLLSDQLNRFWAIHQLVLQSSLRLPLNLLILWNNCC